MTGRYDGASKLWSAVAGAAVAALVDWCAVAIPERHHPPRPMHGGWWLVVTLLALAFPIAWTVDSARARQWNAVVIWVVVVVAIVVGQLMVRSLGTP